MSTGNVVKVGRKETTITETQLKNHCGYEHSSFGLACFTKGGLAIISGGERSTSNQPELVSLVKAYDLNRQDS